MALTGLKRNHREKFYTKKTVAEKCVFFLQRQNIVNEDDILIEPSAGAGIFIPFMNTLSNNCFYYDIEPENNQITKKDFLELDFKNDTNKPIHFIGNPPFGRQSSLARKFIRKCCNGAMIGVKNSSNHT